MKQLSTVYANMSQFGQDGLKTISNTFPTHQHGLIKSDGKEICPSKSRQTPLTEAQVITMTSWLLPHGLGIASTEKVTYGKYVNGAWNSEYPNYHGKEVSVYAPIAVPEKNAIEILQRALIPAGKSNALAHLTHLAMHKHLAKGGAQSVLLSDYALALADVSEFSLAIVCKWFWENDANKFMPAIADIKTPAQIIDDSLRAKLFVEQNKNLPKQLPEPPAPQIVNDPLVALRAEWDAAQRNHELALTNPILDAEFWGQHAEKCKQAYIAAGGSV